jgi:hypothetical protein
MVLETRRQLVTDTSRDLFRKNSDIGGQCNNPHSLTVDDCIETLVGWVENTIGKGYFASLLEDFQNKYGKVNPEDEFYQSRMNYFIEHSVLECPMITSTGPGLAPVSRFLEEKPHLTARSQAGADVWMSVSGFLHGVFEVKKEGDEVMIVRDMISDRSFKVASKAGETLKYLKRKSIFQGFVFGNLERRVLGQGLIVHPDQASKEIHKFIKRFRKYPTLKPNDVLRILAATNMRFLRMQHVNPAVIYSNISS